MPNFIVKNHKFLYSFDSVSIYSAVHTALNIPETLQQKSFPHPFAVYRYIRVRGCHPHKAA